MSRASERQSVGSASNRVAKGKKKLKRLPVTARGLRNLVPYLILVALAVGSGVTVWASSQTSKVPVGPEGVVLDNVAAVGSASTTETGAKVDGMTCQTKAKEVVKYHIHIHVAIYVGGRMMGLPAGIGITDPPMIVNYPTGKFYDVGASDCLYWMHTHVADGIIHVESPVKMAFTLGEFFDVWNQPLSTSRVASAVGTVVVFENGKRLAGDPRLTRLLPQGDIQIDVGTPIVPFQSFKYKVTGGCGEGTLSCTNPVG